MSRYHSYLNSAKEILFLYKGDEPFASFLKKYFSANKKFGSKDRKQVSHLCYCFFRLGKATTDLPMEEKILVGLFLCSDEPNELLQQLKQEWNSKIKLSYEEKCSMLNAQFSVTNVFPWKDELSEGVDHKKFCESFFIQPDLFLRLRPGKEEIVKRKLLRAGIRFKVISETCFALSNASKVDKIIELDREAVVQDWSSQQVAKFLQPVTSNLQPATISVWDCCAGSGGKSIMAYDLNSGIRLVVSDVRETILINLKKRFKEAGIENYQSFVADLTNENLQSSIINNPRLNDSVGQEFSIIIADLPCTGSGTWSRTPEQLYFFNHQAIEQFSNLQKNMVSNVIPHLEPGGSLLYITCSVFKKENEEVVEFMQRKFNLKLKQMEIFKGYDKKADTMFAAVLKK